MIIYLPLLVCLVGLVVYLVPGQNNAKIAEVAKHCFWVGLLVTLLQYAPHFVALPK